MRRLQVAWPERNDGYTYTDFISKREYVGLSVLDFYSKHYYSSGVREMWHERIAAGEVTVTAAANGQLIPTTATATYLLRQGDVCRYQRQPWEEPPAPDYLDLMYEDDHVVAVAKPSGLQVMPAGPYFQRTALDILKQHYGGGGGAGGSSRLGVPTPVHRLGRGTSGTLLCARTPEARRQLSQLMKHATQTLPYTEALRPAAPHSWPAATAAADHSRPPATAAAGLQPGQPDAGGGPESADAMHASDPAGCVASCRPDSEQHPAQLGTPAKTSSDSGTLRKVYRARCSGIIHSSEGWVDCPIGLVQHPGVATGVHAACGVEHGGKTALSRYRVLHQDFQANSTLAEVEIFSGRPHQIRIHMAYIGHPLVGDPMYGPGGLPQAGTRGGVDGTAGSSRPGDCGAYLLHAHLLAVPLLKLGVTGPKDVGMPKEPAGQESWSRPSRIDDGILVLEAPLPMQLQTPLELEQALVASSLEVIQ